jgi:KaiC/GvpD/RAD55 family RecA-like ATPase
MSLKIRTNISQAFWCSLSGGKAKFEPAKILIGEHEDREDVAWFDKLFEGGIFLPKEGSKPLSFLITGPPGSGKTTLALELCYRLARNEGGNKQALFSLYVSTEQETKPLIDNAKSFGYQDVKRYIRPFEGKPEFEHVAVYGREKMHSSALVDIVQFALESLNNWLNNVLSDSGMAWIKRLLKPDPAIAEVNKIRPDILVVDSLNIVGPQDQEEYFEKFLGAAKPGIKLIILILDSDSATRRAYETWEYVSDVVIRLDNYSTNDYYLRTIEVMKARYQGHIWGKQQLKIYRELSSAMADSLSSGRDDKERLRRGHPYRIEGGIFIYPSIHYYLSLYKRRGPAHAPSYAETRPEELRSILRGFPEGRCTAFIGSRGGHKSHLGYLHLLYRVIEHQESALVISLRDDEKMTKETMDQILKQEFSTNAGTLDDFERDDRLEILYYHPGYITPEEFFHRMFMSVHRLKRGRRLTVLFNSLDQLGSRFPLCAKQEIFIPGIIEALSGEDTTSIFIAVDEPGQPAEQYGLLPMADLILSFYPYQFSFNTYFAHIDEFRNLESAAGEFKQQVQRIREEQQKSQMDLTMLQVVRFAGGQRSGARGLLELVSNTSASLYEKPGLHFTPLSMKHEQGTPLLIADVGRRRM